MNPKTMALLGLLLVGPVAAVPPVSAALAPGAPSAPCLADPACLASLSVNLPVVVRDWFVPGCTSPLFVVDIRDDRAGVLVGQGHFGDDWEWGCLYRGPVWGVPPVE